MKTKARSELIKLARTIRVSSTDCDEVIYKFLGSLDTPRSLAVQMLYKSGEHDQLRGITIDPHNYTEAMGTKFRDDFAATSFLSKADFLIETGKSKDEVAFEKFDRFEEQCHQTNRRFLHPLSDQSYNGLNSSLLHAMKRKIADILGAFRPLEFIDKSNWGPGSTTQIKGKLTTATTKFQQETGITRDAYAFVEPWFSVAYPRWSSHILNNGGFSFIEGNSVITVPKDSVANRVICVEPGINLFFQKGIGAMIRSRLRRVGVDLKHNQEKHGLLAKLASETSSGSSALATIDFSSASDSICYELVRELLPPEWFLILDCLRSKGTKLKTGFRRWHKFSSMGNGFTFELESLIFFAAASVVAEYPMTGSPNATAFSKDVISVYGDDVILPAKFSCVFASFTQFLGFTFNMKKSFSTSAFRESCGEYWFNGLDCKPVYLKERLTDAQSLYKLANGIRWTAHRRNAYIGCDSRLLPTWLHILHRLPKSLRLGICAGYGDGGLIQNFDQATPSVQKHGHEGFQFWSFSHVAKTHQSESDGLLLNRLWALPNHLLDLKMTEGERRKAPDIESVFKKPLMTQLATRLQNEQLRNDLPSYGNETPMRAVTRLVLSRISVPRWYNLGSWI